MAPPRLHHPAPALLPEGQAPHLSAMPYPATDGCLSHTLDYFQTYVNMTYLMVSWPTALAAGYKLMAQPCCPALQHDY